MRCESCGVDIPPAWVKIITKNICPECDGEIMSSKSKELLEQLKDAISKMAADPEGLAGWIMSSFDLAPKGTISPTPFYGRPHMGPGAPAGGFAPPGMAQVNPALAAAMGTMGGGASGLKMANSATQQFLKNAGVDKILNNPKTAAMQQMIQHINSNVAEEKYPEEEQISVDEAEDQQSQMEMIAQMAAEAQASGKKVRASQILANNAAFFNGNVEMSQDELTNLQALVSADSHEVSELAKLDGNPALQAERMARLARQRELSRSGGIGKIRRSE